MDRIKIQFKLISDPMIGSGTRAHPKIRLFQIPHILARKSFCTACTSVCPPLIMAQIHAQDRP